MLHVLKNIKVGIIFWYSIFLTNASLYICLKTRFKRVILEIFAILIILIAYKNL